MSESEKGEFEKKLRKRRPMQRAGVYDPMEQAGQRDMVLVSEVLAVLKEMDESFPTYESVSRELGSPKTDFTIHKILRVLNARRCTWANMWFGHKKEEKERLPK